MNVQTRNLLYPTERDFKQTFKIYTLSIFRKNVYFYLFAYYNCLLLPYVFHIELLTYIFNFQKICAK